MAHLHLAKTASRRSGGVLLSTTEGSRGTGRDLVEVLSLELGYTGPSVTERVVDYGASVPTRGTACTSLDAYGQPVERHIVNGDDLDAALLRDQRFYGPDDGLLVREGSALEAWCGTLSVLRTPLPCRAEGEVPLRVTRALLVRSGCRLQGIAAESSESAPAEGASGEAASPRSWQGDDRMRRLPRRARSFTTGTPQPPHWSTTCARQPPPTTHSPLHALHSHTPQLVAPQAIC